MHIKIYYKRPGDQHAKCRIDSSIYLGESLEDDISWIMSRIEDYCSSGFILFGMSINVYHTHYITDLVDMFLTVLFSSDTCERYFKGKEIIVQISMDEVKIAESIDSLFILDGKFENIYLETINGFVYPNLLKLNRRIAAKKVLIYGKSVEVKLDKLFPSVQ